MVYFLFNSHLYTTQVILYIFCTFCLAAAGNIINDYFDVKIDQVNKPNKQIVEKHITSQKAYLIYIFFNLVGLIIGSYICFILKSFNLYFYGIPVIIFLYLYSKKLKGMPLIGNLVIASFTGFSILFFLQILPSNQYQKQIIYILAFFAFLLNLIREIVKDIEDVNGDRKAKLKTLPIVIGVKRSIIISKSLIYLALVCLILVLYSNNNIYLKLYILITLILPLAFSITILKPNNIKKDFTLISKLLKIIIAFGIFTLMFI